MNNYNLDWLLPLEDDEQFVGGLKKKTIPDWDQCIGASQLAASLEEFGDIDIDNPIGGTVENYENEDIGEEGEDE